MFSFSGVESSARFSDVAPRTIGTRNSIFSRLLQEAGGQKALSHPCWKKNTFMLEANPRHLHFPHHKALENQLLPKSVRFKPPGRHPVFQRIMDRASKHCLRARIAICHDHIKTSKNNIENTKRDVSSRINENTFSTLLLFLKSRATSFHNSINARHTTKLANLRTSGSQRVGNNWVVNLSNKPLLPEERSLLEKGPKSLQRLQAYHTSTSWLKLKLPSVTYLMP